MPIIGKRPRVGDSLVEMTEEQRGDWLKLKNLPDSKILSDQECPRCGYEAYLGQFHFYDCPFKDYVRAMCPACGKIIEYDSLLNKFLREGESSKAKTRNKIFNIIIWTAVSVGVFSIFGMSSIEYEKTFLTILIICFLVIVSTIWVTKER